ncbi:Glutamyl-tRNA(Gln) amidotransferase subunit A, mitochondrial [Smittium culicis]|uniref:Glutamyl-tRNA(Gln) amidotransferase subunit A, mitochondrial n=1 Tax=Smittium culicis TaxID=133412 RepID=A0A1R1YBN0_9FUNG|nr:Glutamyl-tRNA(Gln) amidotransferase subunit A, mitochondrial [Smittium culicis]
MLKIKNINSKLKPESSGLQIRKLIIRKLTSSSKTGIDAISFPRGPKVSYEDYLTKLYHFINKKNDKLNCLIHLRHKEEVIKRYKNGSISSKNNQNIEPPLVLCVKDNISVQGSPNSCSSNSLYSYEAPYNATCVDLLEADGNLIIGKTNLDEFGMGSTTTNSAFGSTINTFRTSEGNLSSGGSSGGSAVAVAARFCNASLGSDTGGSIRLPASWCGVVGFKPSYGQISRHGLVAYANSLDTVGILSESASVAKRVYGK